MSDQEGFWKLFSARNSPARKEKKGGPSGDIQSVRPINSHAVQ